jgi:thiosulfate/3-mercaptopyruvate sulfurtransferase
MFLLALAALTAPPPSPRGAEPLLVTTSWLTDHLKDRGLLIFQIGDRASRPAYDAGHIPGAQFLAPLSEFSTPRVEGTLSLELPSAEVLDSVFESKGISNDSRVILYWAQEYYSPTSRALFTLEYAGMKGRVSILDGGLEVWKQEGRPVSTDAPTVARGSFTVHPDPAMVADAEYVKAHLEDRKVRIVDARDSVFYLGTSKSQNSNGHIPGAASIPFGTMVDSSRVLAPAVLRREFAAAGITEGQTVVTYCHVGQQATVVWFAARLLGYDAKLYDGSFQDWTRHTELPIVNPAAPKPE